MTMEANYNNGIGFLGLLGIIFIVLKLTHFINWSWWAVLLPIYGGFALVAIIILGALTIWVACTLRRPRNK